MADPYGRAIRDAHRGQQDDPLLERYGEEALEHAALEEVYFEDFAAEGPDDEWLASWLDGPLVDLGAGTGRHALYFQERFETVAVEVSEHLVATMHERGVRDARHGDMFALREAFERDRFQSAMAVGTQLGLAGSMRAVRRFLGDLAHVTMPDATAVVDSYHPAEVPKYDVPGFRDDPTPGFATRVQQFEYEGDLGEPLLFRFPTPDRLREAAVGTGWTVSEVREHPGDREDWVQYRAALTKRGSESE